MIIIIATITDKLLPNIYFIIFHINPIHIYIR